MIKAKKTTVILLAIAMFFSVIGLVQPTNAAKKQYRTIDGVKYYKHCNGVWWAENYKAKITSAKSYKKKGVQKIEVRWKKPKSTIKNYTVTYFGKGSGAPSYLAKGTLAKHQYFVRNKGKIKDYVGISFEKYIGKGKNKGHYLIFSNYAKVK